MPDWPITLPIYPLVDGYTEHVPSTVLRTEMEAGPAKVRQRTTSAIRKFRLNFLLNKSQTAILEDFYLNMLGGGALSFGFTHPRTDEVLNCRFVSAPGYQTSNGNYFRITAELEAMP